MWYYLFLALFVPSFVTYIIQHVICSVFYKTQNLKKRYNAEWALVTGASSGAEAGGSLCAWLTISIERDVYMQYECKLDNFSGCTQRGDADRQPIGAQTCSRQRHKRIRIKPMMFTFDSPTRVFLELSGCLLPLWSPLLPGTQASASQLRRDLPARG